MSAPGLPRAARILIVGVVAAGACVLVALAPGTARWQTKDVVALVVLVAAISVVDQFTIALPHGEETEYFGLTDAVWMAAVLLGKPGVVVFGVAGGTAVAQAIRRWPLHKLLFNVGQVVLGIAAATGVYHLLSTGRTTHPSAWAAAAAAMTTCFLINDGTVALVIALVRGERFLRVFLAPMRVNLLQTAGNWAIGLLAAIVWTASRPAVLLLLSPLTLLYLAYRGWLRTLRERDQMREVAGAADEIAEAGDLGRRLPIAGEDDQPLAALTTTLNHMLDRLEAAFLRERRFIREASHELRTPITIGRGHLEVLDPDPDPEDLRQTVGLLLDEFDRMGRILEDMTAIVRAERPGFVRPAPVTLGPFLEEVAAKAAPLLSGRLVTDLPVNGAVVEVDEQRLTQALLNLLQNAAIHAPGTSRVELRARPERESWRIEVRDHGDGLPAGEEDAVFQPFYQASSSRGGSGLGLALVRTIAEAHGGAAGVETAAGEGATFWVRVPA